MWSEMNCRATKVQMWAGSGRGYKRASREHEEEAYLSPLLELNELATKLAQDEPADWVALVCGPVGVKLAGEGLDQYEPEQLKLWLMMRRTSPPSSPEGMLRLVRSPTPVSWMKS